MSSLMILPAIAVLLAAVGSVAAARPVAAAARSLAAELHACQRLRAETDAAGRELRALARRRSGSTPALVD